MSDGQSQFDQRFPVSRETRDRLACFEALVRKWQPAVNLVARSTLGEIWQRHILDSAQLWPLLPPGTRTLVDLGSGGGFPGLVLAVLGVPEVHLVESDQRKAAFLREAARCTGVSVKVHATRIEAVAPLSAEVVTARALAPLTDLLGYARRFLGPTGTALFLKGARLEEELTAAARVWDIRSVETIESITDRSGVVVRLRGICPADRAP